ncbi:MULTISPECIES: PucR family transcriptional regulator [Bacillus cereus group]|uniref:PucR family transcriptional regulator n=1 Tax=Bacillus cereus group TaxID=86661 RepID=UPI0007FB5691|nr:MULTISPECIES: PucR family transcriptional regulator [Bacillus cereus group]MCP1399615.1 purine catabolism regulator [Bacillus cereus]MED3447843.1 PucR family transcriptional regulator ligand-binding domain-containing protein [Bacillus thuringiensis]MED4441548.1 PucR family transcriptional regulator ligand-binding domain-containing protein [Bacillus cereus]OBW85058.1 PucR family transcriptional regulator [Bacillus cereus]PEB45728.1 PucR family transcriptional regulator [Bacillus thuringiensi
MKLYDIMKIPIFDQAKLIAGHKGVEQEVYTVNMMDAPDIIHFLKRNELLVTSAYHFKDDMYALRELIIQMKKQGCTALGIKTKRFLQEIPEEIISLADEIYFPIIELPFDIGLGDLVNQTLSYILDMRTNELHQAMQIHQQFSNHIISGKGINMILENLSSLIQLPVVLLDYHLRPISEHNNTKASIQSLKKFFINGRKLPLSTIEIVTFSLLTKTRDTVSIFPIYTQNNQYSYLVIDGFISPLNRSMVLAVEQAANVLAFELIKEHSLRQYSRRIQDEFFTNVINSVFSTQDEIINLGKEFNLSFDQKYICIIGKIDIKEFTMSFMEYQEEKDLIYDLIEEELNSYTANVHLFIKDDMYVLLVNCDGIWRQTEKERMISLLKNIQVKIYTYFQKSISFGIANSSEQLLHISHSFKEATDAFYYGEISGSKEFIEIYQAKEISAILRMIPQEQLKKFYESTLHSLANENEKDHAVLLHTLSVYLETHCAISETAKRLFLHRNTVIYRLEKCEEILGRNIKDPNETLQLRIAFRIKPLIHI